MLRGLQHSRPQLLKGPRPQLLVSNGGDAEQKETLIKDSEVLIHLQPEPGHGREEERDRPQRFTFHRRIVPLGKLTARTPRMQSAQAQPVRGTQVIPEMRSTVPDPPDGSNAANSDVHHWVDNLFASKQQSDSGVTRFGSFPVKLSGKGRTQ
eukprot:9758874-Alexandrium_andersonii.AAC.1